MRLAPLESLLNRNLAASAAARALCQRLDAKVLALHVDGVPLSMYFKSHGEHMTLAHGSRRHRRTRHSRARRCRCCDSPGLRPRRRCAPAPFTSRATPKSRRPSASCSRQAQPDLEEELSRVIGDVAAHQIGNVARTALGFARRAHDTLQQNVAEYLQEEGRDVPSRTEAEEFMPASTSCATTSSGSKRGCAARTQGTVSEPSMRLRVLSRLLQIQRVLVRHRLDEIILATHLFRPLRFAFYLSPATWFRRERDAHARRAHAPGAGRARARSS